MKFKTFSEVVKRFKHCPVCGADIRENWYRFGSDVGFQAGHVYLSFLPYDDYLDKKPATKIVINLESKSSPINFPNTEFDFRCEKCERYNAVLFCSQEKKSLLIVLHKEEIKISYENQMWKIVKDFSKKSATIERLDGTAQRRLAPAFMKLKDYRNLDSRLKSLFLFE